MKSKTAKVILALVLCPLVFLAASFMLPKRYTATMSLMLDPSIRIARPDDPGGNVSDIMSQTRGRSIETEIDKLTGSEVLLDAINYTAAQHPNAFSNSEQADARYSSLVNRLRIDNNRNSDIVDVRVTMDDPQLAADTANNIGKAYMDFNQKISAAAGNGALGDLDQTMKEKKKEIDDVDAKIEKVKARYHVSDPTAAGAIQDKNQTDLEQQVISTQSQLTGAMGELGAAEAALRNTPKYLTGSSSVSLNPKAVDLDQKISQADSDYQAARAKYTDDYPLVKQYAEKLTSLKAERAHTPDNVVSNQTTNLNPTYTQLESAVAQAQSKVNSLQNSLTALRGSQQQVIAESTNYSSAEKELSSLLLQKQSLSNQYALMVQERSPLEINNGMGREAQAQVVSIALPPGAPSFPNPKVFMLMGLAVGIIISALIVMPKAPDVLYAPTAAETLALDASSIRSTTGVLPPTAEPEPARPAIEAGKAE